MTGQAAKAAARCLKYLAHLGRIGVIELQPLNRYRLRLAKAFRWHPHSAVMDYVREHALPLAMRSWKFEAFTALRR